MLRQLFDQTVDAALEGLCAIMGKGRPVCKRTAMKLSSAHIAELSKPVGSTWREKQKATILSGLRALKAPMVT